MCQPQSTTTSAITLQQIMTSPSTPAKSKTKSRRSPKQPANRRRRRRSPSANEPHDESSNSTTCTLSTVPSDSSLDSSFDNHSLDITHSPQRRNARRRRPRKSTNSPNKNPAETPHDKTPKQVQINELTPEQKSHYIGLDAEMVGILDKHGRQRSALARITLVDWNGETLFDSYVRVAQPVVDYRTFVSGIAPRHLQSDLALPPLEVRRIVGEWIHGRVVVGHGLKNDFKALGLSHPWYLTRDSARYQPFMKAPAPDSLTGEYTAKKLKTLALDKLGMIIQREGEAHDPVEDAVAAMELYKKHREKWERAVEWKMERSRGIEMGLEL
ncbi:hypothetical protein ACHAW6_012739 [Cyclotella cf. meneghiniana]